MTDPHLLALDVEARLTTFQDGAERQSEQVIAVCNLQPDGTLEVVIEHADETETRLSLRVFSEVAALHKEHARIAAA